MQLRRRLQTIDGLALLRLREEHMRDVDKDKYQQFRLIGQLSQRRPTGRDRLSKGSWRTSGSCLGKIDFNRYSNFA
jgi:hypothetical protein